MYDLLGPGATERWFYWRSRSKEQVCQSHIELNLYKPSLSIERPAYAVFAICIRWPPSVEVLSSSFIRIINMKQIYKFVQPACSKANRGELYNLQ